MLRIAGDSHSMGLEFAARGRSDVTVTALGSGSVIREVIVDGQIAEKFRDVFAAGKVALVLGNELYNSLCTFANFAPGDVIAFDVASATFPSPQPMPILTEDMIREVLAIRLAPLETICTSAGIAAIISGPPPTRDQDLIRTSYNKRGISILWVAPAQIRLLCWHLQRELTRSIAERHDVPFVDISPDISDASGFLRPEFHNDGIHGNADYYTRNLQHILDSVAA